MASQWPFIPHERVYVFPAGESGESMVKQEFQEDADINAIMRKYTSHGIPPNMVDNPGVFGDFTAEEDYFSANLKVIAARNAFMNLPAEVRAYFKNDPKLLLDAVHDPARKGELVKLGLATFSPEETAFLKAIDANNAAEKARFDAWVAAGKPLQTESDSR